jgi:hypothetical protein
MKEITRSFVLAALTEAPGILSSIGESFTACGQLKPNSEILNRPRPRRRRRPRPRCIGIP